MSEHRATIDKLNAAIYLVDKLMIGEYIGIGYEGWLIIHQNEIDTDQIINMACKVYDYDAGDIASQILSDKADLYASYSKLATKNHVMPDEDEQS